MHRRAALAAVVVPAALVLTACGTEDPNEGMGGFGLPTVAPDQVGGDRSELAGTLHVESDGCFTWTGDDEPAERRWVVWPTSATDDADRVDLGDGTTVTDGDAVVGTGLRTEATALPEWEFADSYFHSFGTFCGAADRGIVVFDEIHPTGG